MKKIKIFPKGNSTNPFANIKWPQRCPYCGSAADSVAEAAITLGKNPKYYGVLISWQNHIYSLKFPICKKHKKFCDISTSFSKMGLVSLFLLFVFGGTFYYIGIVMLGLWVNIHEVAMWFANITLPMALMCYVTLKILFPPIKISKVDETSMTIKMPSEYYEYFKKENKTK